MSDLIEALQIFQKYADHRWPTHCGHDILVIFGIGYDEVSEEDRKRLKELDFVWVEDACGEPCWASYRFGSC